MGDSIIEKHISKLEAEGLATSSAKRNRFFLRCLKELLVIGEVRRVCREMYPRNSVTDLGIQYRTYTLFPSSVCLWNISKLPQKFWANFEEEYLECYIRFLYPQALNVTPQGT